MDEREQFAELNQPEPSAAASEGPSAMMGLSRTIRLYRAARDRERRRQIAEPFDKRPGKLRLFLCAVRDETGGEVLEYALIAGLIVVGCISIISCVGIKLTNKWTTIKNQL